MRYPKHRKSPIRHSVKEHTRQGNRVRSYARGQGKAQQSSFTQRRVLKKEGPKSFTINFKYSNKPNDGESVVVIARNYQDALDEAWEEKTDPRNPISVEVVDPDIGRALKILGRGVAKAVKLGAKYTYVAGKTVTKEAAHAIAKSYREMRVRRLIDEAYSTDRRIRILARAKLKQKYPEIYSICDFSREPVRTYAWGRRARK